MIYEGERERPIATNLGPTAYDEALMDRFPGLAEVAAPLLLSIAETDRARSFSRRPAHYAGTPKRHKDNYSARKVIAATENLAANDLLAEYVVAQPGRGRNKGRQSVLRIAEEVRGGVFEITGRRRVIEACDPVVMKDRDKVLIDYVDTPDVWDIRKWFNENDEMLRSAKITGAEVSSGRIVFNNSSWDEGGRCYWQHQNEPKAFRDDIRIGGEETVGYDFVSIHPSLLYALLGLPIPTDCYDIEGVTRNHQKLGLMVMINADSELSAATRIAADLENAERRACALAAGVELGTGWKIRRGESIPRHHQIGARVLMQQIECRHAPIAGAFYTSAGTMLQNIDGRISRAVISMLVKRGIEVMSWHDGFRVKERHGHVLEDAMRCMAVEVGKAALQVKREKRHAPE